MSAPTYKGNTRRRVRCQSGIMGERSRLQSRYASLEEFAAYAETYGLLARLGFPEGTSDAIETAWDANPVIESSVNPADLRRVYP